MPESLCKFPIFNFAFSFPLPSLPNLFPPIPDFSVDIDLSCPLDDDPDETDG